VAASRAPDLKALGFDDSKKLSEETRERMFEEIKVSSCAHTRAVQAFSNATYPCLTFLSPIDRRAISLAGTSSVSAPKKSRCAYST
jgi:ribonuclease HII